MPTPTDLLNDKTIELTPEDLRKSYALQIKNIFGGKIESPISDATRKALEQVWREVEKFILET